MSTHGLTFRARGMHCTGCEHIIEESVRQLPGIQRVKADYPTEMVAVVFDPALTNGEAICAAVSQKGYRCCPPGDAEAPRNRFLKFAGAALAIAGIFFIIFLDTKWISQSGAPDISQHMGYGLILLLGLLTGFHCVGMCGGFVLSYTAANARLGQSSYLSHVLYGAGKTLSYTLIGALFGLLGAVIAFTPMLRGTAGIMAGIFLIIFGLNMLNVFPVLRQIRLKLPVDLTRFIGRNGGSRGRPLVIGLLNGLMIACGPLQAMYVMAAGTGSAVEGAKMLFTFGIGTLPVLLSFGVLTSLISTALTHQLLRASGAILILLGAVMINRGIILTGTGYDLQSAMTSASSKLGLTHTPPASPLEGDVQIIKMAVTKSGYEPNHFVLRDGVRVKWIIEGKEITECNRRIVVPKLGLEFDVKEGVQTVEFTPKETGNVFIPWSCWMGMLHGQFEIVEGPKAAPDKALAGAQTPPSVVEPSAPPPAADMAASSPPPKEEPPVPQTGAATKTYKIAAGDTLAKIAVKLYGDATKWREIANANPGLKHKKLKPGQIIQLPPLSAKDTLKKAP